MSPLRPHINSIIHKIKISKKASIYNKIQIQLPLGSEVSVSGYSNNISRPIANNHHLAIDDFARIPAHDLGQVH